MIVFSPISTFGPITVKAPMLTLEEIFAFGSINAVL